MRKKDISANKEGEEAGQVAMKPGRAAQRQAGIQLWVGGGGEGACLLNFV